MRPSLGVLREDFFVESRANLLTTSFELGCHRQRTPYRGTWYGKLISRSVADILQLVGS